MPCLPGVVSPGPRVVSPGVRVDSSDTYFILFFSKGALLADYKRICDDRSSLLSRHLDSSVVTKTSLGMEVGNPGLRLVNMADSC